MLEQAAGLAARLRLSNPCCVLGLNPSSTSHSSCEILGNPDLTSKYSFFFSFIFIMGIVIPMAWAGSVTQSCLTLGHPMNCSLSGFFAHGIFQARRLEWVAISFSRGSSQPRDRNPGLPHCRQDALPSEPLYIYKTSVCLGFVPGPEWKM